MDYEIINLNLEINQIQVLNNYSIKLSNSITLICGANGSGKTTLLKILHGDFIQENNKIQQNQIPVTNQNSDQFSFFGLNTLGILPDLTGEEQFNLIQHCKKIINFENEIYQSEIIKKCFKTKGQDFSNGMKQMFKYYLHSYWNPKCLFLDEPFSFLDPYNQNLMKQDLEKRKNHSLIFITHQTNKIEGLTIDQTIELNS
jgi:ABC-2 type transport system ATP-binding protein